MNLKKILLLATSTIFISTSANSEPIQRESTDGLTYIGIGKTYINIDAINKTIVPLGYPEFPNNLIIVGAGSRNFSGKIVTGGEGYFTLDNKITNTQNGYNGFNSSSFSVLGDIGYLVYSSDKFKLYPLVGLGLGKVNFDFFKYEKSPQYNNLIKEANKGISLSEINAVLDLALGGNYIFGLGKSKPQKGGLTIGFRAGYTFTLYSTGLQIKGENILNAPDTNNNGFYVRVNAGYTDGIIPALLDLF